MARSLSASEQRLLGYIDTKLKVLDVLIDYSEKHGGILTINQLKATRQGLEDEFKKMEVAEAIEKNNIKSSDNK